MREEKYVYESSLDIDGAFDTVPHLLLVNALAEMEVDWYILRFMCGWLRKRKFRIRLNTAAGTFISKTRPISRGLPQGGKISPLLWLVLFDEVLPKIERKRAEEPEVFGEANFQDFIYADDITTVFAHKDAGEIPRIATRNAEIIQEVLNDIRLRLSCPKSLNFAISPGLIARRTFRRMPKPQRYENMERPMQDQQNETKLDDLTEAGRMEQGVFPRSMSGGLPFEWKETIRILGVLFDPLLAFRQHVQGLLSRARVRRSIMVSLSRSNWGLETGIPRTTHDALLVGLTRYGLVTVGSGIYETDFKALETRHTNIAARRVLDLGPTARLETLFSTADLISAHNLYLRGRATLLDRGFRAVDCSHQSRMDRWTRRVYGVETWRTKTTWLS